MYGTTIAYSSATPTADAGSGTTSVQVSATVTGLSPDTTYLYRLVTVNSTGTSVGVGQTVSTAASACVVDQQSIASDQQTVTKDKATVTAQQYTVAATSAGQAVTSSTIAQDQAQVTQDQNTVTADQKAVNDTVLTAPVSGIVTSVNDVVGEAVTGSGTSSSASGSSSTGSTSSSTTTGSGATGSGSTGATGSGSTSSTGTSSTSSSGSSSSSAFVTIQDIGSLEVVAGFAEANVSKMAVGETATATLPALPNTTVTGTVVAVSPTSTVTSNVVTYDVTIALQNTPSSVKVGMTADVSVVVQTANNTLELPSAAITTTGPISTVTVLANGKRTVTTVTTGLVGDSTTQILSGVTVGEVVVEPVASVSGSTTSGSSTAGGGGFGPQGGFGGGGLGGGG
jgi:multidrug efflux pump subunit AcrA (membrane-fusion protein)